MMGIKSWPGRQYTGYKNKESTRNRPQRARYLRQSAVQWGHLHSGGEVVNRPKLKRRGMRIRTTHRKGWSGSMGGVAYSNSKSRLENE
jgi:crotonobetainyl-CoA:carnitine CoA-transferase CaiB-like acyl-CoA transferase